MGASVIVVMGVSGSGKTTVAARLAARLGWALAEADEFHSAQNVEKMRNAIALTDADRGPWLDAIAAWIDALRGAGGQGVVTCSALKRSYRARLAHGRDDVRFVYLKGSYELIARRLAARRHAYMPPALLKSQFDTLEEPGADENPLVVSIELAPEAIVERIVAELGLGTRRAGSAPPSRGR